MNTFEYASALLKNDVLNVQNFQILSVIVQKDKKTKSTIAKILVPKDLVELCKNEVLALMPDKYKNFKIDFSLYACKKVYYKVSSVFMGSFVKIKEAINKTGSFFSELYESAKSKIFDLFSAKKETKTESLQPSENLETETPAPAPVAPIQETPAPVATIQETPAPVAPIQETKRPVGRPRKVHTVVKD